MIRKLVFLSLFVATSMFFSSPASAQMPSHVRDALNKLVGTWKVTTTIGDDTSEWNFKCHWSPTIDAIVYS